jgi:Zn-dependent protease
VSIESGHLIAAVNMVSGAAYAFVFLVTLFLRDGPTWTLFKAVLLLHGIAAWMAGLYTWHHALAADPMLNWVAMLRLFGAMGNGALAIALWKSLHKSNQPSG